MTVSADTEPQATEAEQPLWRRTLSLLFTLAIVAAVIYLWPAPLGGATRLVVVSGQSMEPTYDLGDIVVTRDGGTPEVGDTVVFAVPEGNAEGMLVIHRIVDVDDDGFFITQGDNRDTPDQWPLTEDDIVGEPLLHVPKGGIVVRFVQQLWVLAIVVGLLVMALLWPDSRDEDETEIDDTADGDATKPDDVTTAMDRAQLATADWASAEIDDAPTLDDITDDITTAMDRTQLETADWASAEIDDTMMAEAEAWLDEQLAAVLDEPIHTNA